MGKTLWFYPEGSKASKSPSISRVYVLNGYQLSHKNNKIMHFVWNTFMLLYMQGKLLYFNIQHLVLYYFEFFWKIKFRIGYLQYS